MNLSRLAASALLSWAAAALVACTREPAPALAEPSPEAAPGKVASSTAPTSSATAGASAGAGPTASASALPPMDDACKLDADCTLYMDPRSDEPCCPACTGYKGASKSSFERHRAACAGRYGMCAGSCAAPAMHAECRAGHCAVVADKP
jgi:hypothetical protein